MQENQGKNTYIWTALLITVLIFVLLAGMIFAPHIRPSNEVVLVDSDKGRVKSRVLDLEGSFSNLTMLIRTTNERVDDLISLNSDRNYAGIVESLQESNKQIKKLIGQVEELNKKVTEE
jgi:hypothetical protein